LKNKDELEEEEWKRKMRKMETMEGGNPEQSRENRAEQSREKLNKMGDRSPFFFSSFSNSLTRKKEAKSEMMRRGDM